MREKVLLVDDDDLLVRSLKMLLWNEGLSVTTATSGKEAISIMDEEGFDIIVTDIKMPDVDGLEFITRVRNTENNNIKEAAVIVITGCSNESTPIEALKLGATDYLLKPLETADFMNSIMKARAVLAERRQKNEIIKRLQEKIERLTKELQDCEKNKNQ
jgi:YesN/AraC family two-component response regulator